MATLRIKFGQNRMELKAAIDASSSHWQAHVKSVGSLQDARTSSRQLPPSMTQLLAMALHLLPQSQQRPWRHRQSHSHLEHFPKKEFNTLSLTSLLTVRQPQAFRLLTPLSQPQSVKCSRGQYESLVPELALFVHPNQAT